MVGEPAGDVQITFVASSYERGTEVDYSGTHGGGKVFEDGKTAIFDGIMKRDCRPLRATG